MDRNALRSFVVDAHRNGYASDSPDAVSEEPEGTVIEYADGDWRYVDRYAGSRSFVGHEVVLRNGAPVWGMHYAGAPTGESVDHEPLYAFLRDALAEVSRECPYRGPTRFDDRTYCYRSDVEGDLASFRGTETVERAGEVAYRGQFGGGTVE